MSKWDIVTAKDVARQTRPAAPTAKGILREDDAPSVQPQSKDDWLQRLVKYIPAETVAAFIALDNLAKVAPKLSPQVTEWIVFFGMFLYTWAHLKRIRRVSRSSQVAISLVAFSGWAAGIGGPFNNLSFWSPVLGSIAVIAVTLIIPLIEPDSLPVMQPETS